MILSADGARERIRLRLKPAPAEAVRSYISMSTVTVTGAAGLIGSGSAHMLLE
jgi:hypothetical protein